MLRPTGERWRNYVANSITVTPSPPSRGGAEARVREVARCGGAKGDRRGQPLLDEEERLVGRHAAHVELGRDARRGAGGAANGGADVRLAFALLHALDLAEGDAGAEGA